MPDERLRAETGPVSTKERTSERYRTSHGVLDVVLDRAAGETTVSHDGEPALVASWAPGNRMSIRDGVEVVLDGRSGRVRRPSFGLRAANREVELTVGDRTWRARVRRPGRIVLSRNGTDVAQHRYGRVDLFEAADRDDAAVTALFSSLELWSYTRLWTRVFDAF